MTRKYLILLQLFGGVLVSLESLGDWVRWVHYLSFSKYGVEVSKLKRTEKDLMFYY